MNKNFWYILGIGILLIFICWFMMSPASAYDRIDQGSTVILNGTYDISGVAAGYNQLVYLNYWSTDLTPDNESITYTLELPQERAGYFNFYIDPAIFKNRLGYWYRYNGVFEPQANNRAFRVVADRQTINVTVNVTGNETVLIVPQAPPIEERHIADYLIARGDPLYISFPDNTPASAWIFGRRDGIFNREVINGIASFNTSEIQSMEPGSYTLMYYSPGSGQKFDVRVNEDKLEYFDSAEFKIVPVDIEGLSPSLVLDRILQVVDHIDDKFTLYKLEIQNPLIEITEVEVIDVSETAAVLQLQGYTNLAYNSELTFVLDEHKTNARTIKDYRWNTTAKAVGNPGSMRYFDLSIPVIWKALSIGEHSITAHTPSGETSIVPLWVYDMPGGMQKPNQTIKYVAGNLFVPTPTPVMVPVPGPTRIVTQVVTVQLTPDYGTLAKTQNDQWWVTFWKNAENILVMGLIGIIIGSFIIYLAYVYYRRKKNGGMY